MTVSRIVSWKPCFKTTSHGNVKEKRYQGKLVNQQVITSIIFKQRYLPYKRIYSNSLQVQSITCVFTSVWGKLRDWKQKSKPIKINLCDFITISMMQIGSKNAVQNNIFCNRSNSITFISLWANSADDNLVIVFLFCPEKMIWHFMQIVSNGDNLHETSNPVFREK